MPSNTFKGVVQLSKEQFNTLKTNGSLTVGQDTLVYDPNATLYVTDMFVYVPTKTSDLINDSNFATTSQIPGIVDDLNSVDNTKSLSANQGRILNEKITGILNNVAGGVQSFTVQNIAEMGNLFGLEILEQADSFAVGSNTITYDNKSYTLKNGDIFLIVDIGVPDYWFSSTDMTLYRLETNKVDLSGFATTDFVAEAIANNKNVFSVSEMKSFTLYDRNSITEGVYILQQGARIYYGNGAFSSDSNYMISTGVGAVAIFEKNDSLKSVYFKILTNKAIIIGATSETSCVARTINFPDGTADLNKILKVTTAENNSSKIKTVATWETLNVDISSKLDKVTSSGSWRTYAIDESGEQDILPVAITEATANGGSIPTYMASTSGTTAPAGRLVTNDPTNDYHATTKKYVDSAINDIPFPDGIKLLYSGGRKTVSGGETINFNSGVDLSGVNYFLVIITYNQHLILSRYSQGTTTPYSCNYTTSNFNMATLTIHNKTVKYTPSTTGITFDYIYYTSRSFKYDSNLKAYTMGDSGNATDAASSIQIDKIYGF